MKAGRELDALIAEKVMRLKVRTLNEVTGNSYKLQYDRLVLDVGNGRHDWIPDYSTNIRDAWLVVEKLDKDRKFLYVSNVASGWKCNIEADRWYAIAETAPLAICFASLRCMEIDI